MPRSCNGAFLMYKTTLAFMLAQAKDCAWFKKRQHKR